MFDTLHVWKMIYFDVFMLINAHPHHVVKHCS